MLRALTIQNVVLIEGLDLELAAGLTVLTGETGAGKSILLDGLGLALGERADSALVRAGQPTASVIAEFAVPLDHPAAHLLAEQDLSLDDSALVVRRQLRADGSGRAFINDRPVSVGLLKEVGRLLVEIHGQHDERGLINPRGHRALLDAFASAQAAVAAVERAWAQWRATQAALEDTRTSLEDAERERDYLTHAVDELTRLAPQPGEEALLAADRARALKAGKIEADLAVVLEQLGTADGALSRLRQAARRLERISDGEPALVEALARLDQAVEAAAEAEDGLLRASAQLGHEPARAEAIEARLFDLRAAARKHRVTVDDLPAMAADLAAKLALLERGQADLAAQEAAVAQAEAQYRTAADALRAQRQAAATQLDKAVAHELAPLKLERAQFRTTIEPLEPAQWGPGGTERVAFEIATNPGAPFGPLSRIASGGELSRFMLALKVALAAAGSARTLIFDEIDRGVGGAVAAAIGERLARLAGSAQVLVVTHSPQVAASGAHQWRIAKQVHDGAARTTVVALDASARREEIARMLSGDAVTPEARAQADRLLAGV
jgi:DNA repair protein RecN (Recombination protein N)